MGTGYIERGYKKTLNVPTEADFASYCMGGVSVILASRKMAGYFLPPPSQFRT